MKSVDLAEYLIKQIVKDPEAVSIKGFETEDEIIIEVLVSKEDIGRVIGKDGKMIASIRTIVNAIAYHNGEKKTKINIDSI